MWRLALVFIAELICGAIYSDRGLMLLVDFVYLIFLLSAINYCKTPVFSWTLGMMNAGSVYLLFCGEHVWRCTVILHAGFTLWVIDFPESK
jgi:hypothetical protein